MNKALLLSGKHEGREVYRLVLPRMWITYSHDNGGESREEFIHGTSEEIVGAIKEVYGLDQFKLFSKRGVLILGEGERTEVEEVDASHLESKLKEKLANEIVLPLNGGIC